MTAAFDALVLAGGEARRLRGADKPSLEVGGVSLLERVLAACAAAVQTIVVGPPRPTSRPVCWCREDPPGGGPVPALRAGLRHVRAPQVVLLAADLPFLTSEALQLLLTEAPAVLTDGNREQWLCGAWPTSALRVAAHDSGDRLHQVLAPLGPRIVTWGGVGTPWLDCDTDEDLEAARHQVTLSPRTARGRTRAPDQWSGAPRRDL